MTSDTNQNESSKSGPTESRRSRAGASLIVAGLIGAGLGGMGVYFAVRAPSPEAAVATTHEHGASQAPTAAPAHKAVYRCPMHPAVTSDHPGQCPICGMTLVLDADPGVAATNTDGGISPAGLGPVAIDNRRQQLIGLRTTTAVRGAAASELKTSGRIAIDPTRVRRINVKVEGFVERVFVDFVGKPVRRGQPLLSIYSPSVLAAEEEYLLALKTSRRMSAGGAADDTGASLLASARRRLELWDVSATELSRLETTGVASKTLTIVSPIAGVVTTKSVVEGGTLRTGDTPYEITDLSVVWLLADAYESDLSRIHLRMPATLTLAALPDRTFQGRVEFIDPTMDPRTRTVKVRVQFANPRGELKPELFGDVVLHGAARDVVQVPTDAVIHAGTKDIVFVAEGEGRFVPREVHVGTRTSEIVEIVHGVDAGESVVTRANFLVDSESRLRASLSALQEK